MISNFIGIYIILKTFKNVHKFLVCIYKELHKVQ